jgi:DNA-binding transcriptional ArsR family regulator
MANNIQTCSDGDVCDVRVIHVDKIKQARESVIPDELLQRLARIYRLLGDPTRLKILIALKQVEMCVCDIAAFLDMTESAVSHQLRRLRDMAIVKRRRHGQILYYSLSDELVAAVLELGIARAG